MASALGAALSRRGKWRYRRREEGFTASYNRWLGRRARRVRKNSAKKRKNIGLYYVVSRTLRRVAVLISGRGSNMREIVRVLRQHDVAGAAVHVISNRPEAQGLTWAREQGLSTQVVDHRAFATREEFDAALGCAIAAHTPDYVLLAGFMRILTPALVARFAGQMLNIHPSLLPLFPGLHTHQQALESGARWHGCTVHFVTAQLDHGPIVAQGVVPVYDSDTADTLAARLLPLEHRVYGQVAQWLAQGRVALDAAGNVRVAGEPTRAFTDWDGGIQREVLSLEEIGTMPLQEMGERHAH